MTAEIWKPIPESRGLYEASDRGRIRSLKGSIPRVMRHQTSNPVGHQKLDLRIDGRRCPRWVHRLVLEAFVGPCPPGQEVRHLDGDATNNALTNLAYGTRFENARDIVAHGRHNYASRTHCPQGHEYTPENTIQSVRQRHCRICSEKAQRAWAARPIVCDDCGKTLKRASLSAHRRLGWCKGKKADAETRALIEARVKALEEAALNG